MSDAAKAARLEGLAERLWEAFGHHPDDGWRSAYADVLGVRERYRRMAEVAEAYAAEQTAALRAELAQEKIRADENFRSWERVRQKFSDHVNETAALRAVVKARIQDEGAYLGLPDDKIDALILAVDRRLLAEPEGRAAESIWPESQSYHDGQEIIGTDGQHYRLWRVR